MKLRIRRTSDTLHFDADTGDGHGYVEVKSIRVPNMPVTLHPAVTAPATIGAWPVLVRSET